MKSQLQTNFEESKVVPVRSLEDLRELRPGMKVNIEFTGARPNFLLPYNGKIVEMTVEENEERSIRFMKKAEVGIESWGTCNKQSIQFGDCGEMIMCRECSSKKVYLSMSYIYQDKLKLLNS